MRLILTVFCSWWMGMQSWSVLPTVEDIKVSATVVDHVKGPKVRPFKYRPKKRIRVKSGHRHQYTRLMIDFIGKPGEERKLRKRRAAKKASPGRKAEAEVKVEKRKGEGSGGAELREEGERSPRRRNCNQTKKRLNRSRVR
jgi:hypothetical protein